MFLIMVQRAKHVGNYVSAGYSICILWQYVTEHSCINSTQYTMNTFKFMDVSTVGKQIVIKIVRNKIFIKLTFTFFDWYILYKLATKYRIWIRLDFGLATREMRLDLRQKSLSLLQISGDYAASIQSVQLTLFPGKIGCGVKPQPMPRLNWWAVHLLPRMPSLRGA